MIYSLEERKIGSYFGEDLYEACAEITLPDDTNELDVNSDIFDYFSVVDKIINTEARIEYTVDTMPTVINTNFNDGVIKINAFYYDYNPDDDTTPDIYLNFDNSLKGATGIIKIQYTKRSS